MDRREPLEMRAAFDQDAVSSRRGQRRHERHWRRDHQRAWAGDDEQNERSIEPRGRVGAANEWRDKRDQHRQRNHRGCVDAGKAIDEGLYRGAARLRIFNQVNDVRQPRIRPDARDYELERSTAVDRSCIRFVAGTLVYRQRFPRHRRFVDVAVAGDDRPVQRNLIAGPDDDDITDGDRLDRDALLRAVAFDDRFARRQINPRANRLTCTLERPRLEPLSKRE